jgi:hypothetical protein
MVAGQRSEDSQTAQNRAESRNFWPLESQGIYNISTFEHPQLVCRSNCSAGPFQFSKPQSFLEIGVIWSLEKANPTRRLCAILRELTRFPGLVFLWTSNLNRLVGDAQIRYRSICSMRTAKTRPIKIAGNDSLSVVILIYLIHY